MKDGGKGPQKRCTELRTRRQGNEEAARAEAGGGEEAPTRPCAGPGAVPDGRGVSPRTLAVGVIALVLQMRPLRLRGPALPAGGGLGFHLSLPPPRVLTPGLTPQALAPGMTEEKGRPGPAGRSSGRAPCVVPAPGSWQQSTRS